MAVLNVPNEYCTIQSAVDAAKFGDIIKVCPGVYNESIQIDPCKCGLKIMSACCSSRCILTGRCCKCSCCNDSLDNGFIINSNQVTICGFTIKNFKFNGIKICGNQNIISNCGCCKNNCNGIYVGNECSKNLCINTKCYCNCNDGFDIDGKSNYIIKCTASNNENEGIEFNNNYNYAIQDKCYCNKNEGIEIEGRHCTIINNCCYKNCVGIGINSNSNLIYNNTITNNIKDGILMFAPEKTETNNNCSCNTCSCNENSYKKNLLLLNCIKNNCGTGLELESCSQCNILYNSFSCNGKDGLNIKNGSCNIIDDCSVLYNCCAGIKINECTVDNLIRNNMLCCNCPNVKANRDAIENNIVEDNHFC